MAAGPRPASRPGGAPGRGRSRARTPVQAYASKGVVSTSSQADGAAPRGGRRLPRINLSARAVAFAAVLVILTISYATSLRIYFSQAHDIAATKVQIAEREQRIGELRSDLAKWEDPEYVKTQAREQLGWVVPGETGFKVVDANGKPLGGGAEITGASVTQPPRPAAWWDKLWGSVEAADQPAPLVKKDEDVRKITPDTKPR